MNRPKRINNVTVDGSKNEDVFSQGSQVRDEDIK
jgi:hypothetical protein